MAGGPVACGAPATLSGTRTFPRSFISILSSSCMTGGVVALIHRWVWARQRFPQIRPPRPVHTAVSVPQSGEGGDAPARPSPDRARVCTDARSLLRARASPRRRRSDLGRGARSSEPDHGSRGVVEQIPGQHDLPLSEQVARGAFPGGDAHRKGMPHRRRCERRSSSPPIWTVCLSRCAVVDEPEIPPSRPLRSNSVDLRLRRPGPRRVLPRS